MVALADADGDSVTGATVGSTMVVGEAVPTGNIAVGAIVSAVIVAGASVAAGSKAEGTPVMLEVAMGGSEESGGGSTISKDGISVGAAVAKSMMSIEGVGAPVDSGNDEDTGDAVGLGIGGGVLQ